jgi:taurine--2-oxoglutarate transaminase
VVRVEDPYCYRCPFGQQLASCARECISHIERVIEFEGPHTVAAILMEGASGSSGCYTYPPDYWPRLRELCDRHGIVLIDDEVASGFGRTGKWFAVDHTSVVPDLMVVSKGLTSGYLPLGAVLVSDRIAAHFDSNPLAHGLTAQSHPASCAAALANIRVIEEEGLLENAERMGKLMRDRCEQLAEAYPVIGDIRITGLIGVLELVTDRVSKEWLVPNIGRHSSVIQPVSKRILDCGVSTLTPWNMILLAPPLMISEAELEEGMAAVAEGVKVAQTLV